MQWDAEIINEKEGELIGWRSVPGGDLDHAGSVRFLPLPGRPGSEVRVTLQYQPPGGTLGSLVARLLGPDPERTIREDLSRFKRIMEEGDLNRIDT